MRTPSSRPGGMSMDSSVSSATLPWPLQLAHGDSTSWPLPPQAMQVLVVTSWPSRDWRTVRCWPVPWQALQVVAAAGARAGARAGGERVAAEEGVDHVGERSEAERVGRHLLAVEPGLPEGVVALPLLRVAEHAVGLGDLLEALLSVRVAGVEVRVVLARQLAVGALDLLGRGIAADAEHGVVVGHPALLDSSSGAGTPSSLLDRDVVARPGPPPQDAYLQIIEQVT